MGIEQFENIFCILMNLTGLMVSLFNYVRKPRKVWIYTIILLLCHLLSNYYWGVYVLVMGGSPNVSSVMAYFGWNMAFAVLPVIFYQIRYEEEKGFFSPFSLLPIPLNFYQLMLYLKFGGYFNNIWQGIFATFSSCLSLNSLIYYFKNRKKGARIPYVSATIFLYIVTEYIMWTSSCFDWPSEAANPYNYGAILLSFSYILIPFAIIKTYSGSIEDKSEMIVSRLQKIFKPLYSIVVLSFCISGYFLALWMRNTLMAGINQVGSDTDPYSVIAVMLFVISVVIVSFSMAVVFIVDLVNKSAQSKRLMEEKTFAERSNAAKSEFLANMSHEIRTPINAVLGMNEIILKESLKARDDLPEERSEIRNVFSSICSYSGNIDSAGKNLLSIINDILDYSRIEAGNLELSNGEYKLSSILNDINNIISFKTMGKGLEFTMDVDNTMPDCLYGDDTRVRQVIINLLNNAVKYTNKGNVHLSINSKIRTDSEEEKMTDIIISVRDTGIGIKQDDLDKLFEKFERIDLEQNSTVEGTGLGLAITRNLLNMMGGSIRAESVYGKGSTFTAVIPQKVISDEPIGNFKSKFEKSILSMKAPKEILYAPDAKILVVDDTHINLMVFKGLLKNTGIKIDIAESGMEAIDKTGFNKYDMIFMDQRMPKMDGVETMHIIKKDKENFNADTPIICLTADAVRGAKEKYISEGFDDYITKPVDSLDLKNMILKHLPEKMLKEAPKDEKLYDRESVGKYMYDDMYDNLLTAYVIESESKIPAIEKFYEEKNWKDYGTMVHALKSTSKMIGSTELSEKAARMEAAAAAGDTELISKEHDDMLKLYKEVVTSIKQNHREDIFSGKLVSGENGVIMEFEPKKDPGVL